MNKKNKGSALIIAIICIVIVSIIMIYFLEKLLPIAKNIKGIENSTVAYYNALTGVEDAMLFMKTSAVGAESGVTYNSSNLKGFGYHITASGSKIPIPGEGNSDYSGDRNIIGQGRPIQLAIGSGINWNNVAIFFKTPDGMSLISSLSNSGIINWQLSGKSSAGTGLVLYASGETNMIKGNNIDGSNNISLGGKNGFDLDGNTGLVFSLFYSSGTGLNSCTSNLCSLKFSIVQPLISSLTGQKLPYLEYTMDFLSSSVPLQYARIESDGYSYGFKRTIKRYVKQVTTTEAADFTVIN